jgi:SH3 domain protein
MGVNRIMVTKKKQNRVNRLSDNFFPCALLLLFFTAALFSVSPAVADTWYVKPSAEVPIRSGQGTDFKILAVVPDGLMVEILEEEDPWAKVRTPGGTEGWMLKRYLSSDLPLSEAVASLKAQKAELETINEETNRQLAEVSAAYTRSEEELRACTTERDAIRQEYQTLREDTADVIKIKQTLSKKIQESDEAGKQLAAIKLENDELRRNTTLMWFLAGGFLLIVGWIIGMMTGRSRKRRSSLL